MRKFDHSWLQQLQARRQGGGGRESPEAFHDSVLKSEWNLHMLCKQIGIYFSQEENSFWTFLMNSKPQASWWRFPLAVTYRLEHVIQMRNTVYINFLFIILIEQQKHQESLHLFKTWLLFSCLFEQILFLNSLFINNITRDKIVFRMI